MSDRRLINHPRAERGVSTEHTPGPWRVTPATEGSCPLGVGQYVQDSAGNHVAYDARSPADARLIAAAPELLVALSMAHTLLDAILKHDRPKIPENARLLQGMVNIIRAAIAKTEGS